MTAEYLPRTRRRVLLSTLASLLAVASAAVAGVARVPALFGVGLAFALSAIVIRRRRKAPILLLPSGPLPVVEPSDAIERVRVDPAVTLAVFTDRRSAPLTAEDLQTAFDEGQIHVAYQPKVSMTDGYVCGVEALARWRHPERGPISPGTFVPLAEQSGLDGRLFSYMLEHAVSQVATWHRRGLPVDVAVNITASRLCDRRLPAIVQGILAQTRLPAASLILEVTEGQMLPDDPDAVAVVEFFRELGVRLSIDDFGTGYSSLIQLAKVPFAEVKIDRSFVIDLTSDPMSEAIVTSVVELGERLGISVVAEGVENEATWNHLVSLRCPTAQGYLMCEPAAASLVEPWIRARGVRRPTLAQSAS